MLAVIYLLCPGYLPGIQRVLQDVSHCCVRTPVSILCGISRSHIFLDTIHRPALEVQREHLPHLHCFVLVYDKPSAALGNGLVIVADGSIAAAVEKAGLCPTDTANRHALPDLLTLKLSEHGQDADHSPAKRRGSPGELNTLVDPVPYVQSVENISTSSGGADRESDESFAARIFIAPGKYSTAGSRNSYEYHVQDYSSAIGGVHVSSDQAAGTVDIVFVMADGSLPSAEMISAMSQHMSAETLRPMSDLVTVRAPAEVKYTIALTYYINQSDNNRAVAIQQAVSAAVDSYIAWQRKIGRDINPSKLLALVMGAGAKRVQITAPTFSAIPADSIAAIDGTAAITYGGLEDD